MPKAMKWRQAESSGNGMAIEAVMMNDEEAWDDVREVLVGQKSAEGVGCIGGREAQRRATG